MTDAEQKDTQRNSAPPVLRSPRGRLGEYALVVSAGGKRADYGRATPAGGTLGADRHHEKVNTRKRGRTGGAAPFEDAVVDQARRRRCPIDRPSE